MIFIKKNGFLTILFMIFFYLNIFVSMMMLIDTWVLYVDNGQIKHVILLIASSVFSFYISYYIISIILHELGHLVMGKIFDWKIYSFNVLGTSITKKDRKYIFYKRPTKGFAGYVEMTPKTDNQNFIVPMLGGIIANVILSIIFFIILLFTKNQYLICICNGFIFSNLLLAVTNSMPFTPTAATKTDVYQIIEFNKNKKEGNLKYYINFIDIYTMYNNMYLKDIDDKYYLLDVSNKCSYVQLIHMAYIDKIVSIGEFKKAQKVIEDFLNDELVEENNKIGVSFVLMFCMIMNKEPKEKIKELFNSSRIQNNIKDLEYMMTTELYSYYKYIDINDEKTKYYYDMTCKRIKSIVNEYEKSMLMDLLKYAEERGN